MRLPRKRWQSPEQNAAKTQLHGDALEKTRQIPSRTRPMVENPSFFRVFSAFSLAGARIVGL